MADGGSPAPLPLGSTVGILGGGQLGRMLALAAARLGMRTHIYCPDPASPAFDVTPRKTVAAYDDLAALAAFAGAVDVVTCEFENVPAATAQAVATRSSLRPGPNALAIAQDRLAEKAFLTAHKIEVAPYRPVSSLADLHEAIAALGLPAVLKTTRLGYDGKGQRLVHDAKQAAAAFAALTPKPLVLEAFVPFEKEISVIVARNAAGEVRTYDAAENTHEHHILRTSAVPAAVAPIVETHASRTATAIVRALDYAGVLGVEYFVVLGSSRPQLLVNEIAPRVHNSGHWTEAVCVTDQFEQHIRAVCNWPLGDTTRFADAEMTNLLGDDILTLPAALGPGLKPNLYGKAEARPGRKMGHINRITPRTVLK